MRPVRRFEVRPAIPEALAALPELATNLHWAWDRELVRLFERIWPGWTADEAHPAHMVRTTPSERLEALAADQSIVRDLAAAKGRLDAAITGPTWFATRTDSPLGAVAYFSPEFGLTEALPQYSGGLGVLAGDHLKASSDLGVPLVGVGLLYTEGYFHQELDAEGWQQELTVNLDPESLGLTDTGVVVTIDMAGDDVSARVWRAQVGKVDLYLLDTDVEGNSPDAVAITDRLYGGDNHHRLRQEIVLGIGGVRALRALDIHPQVFHTNEGHAGFLGLERIREHVASGTPFAAAVEAVRGGGVFTTHTPVPAGIDRFERTLIERYFSGFAEECGVSIDELFAIGESPDEADVADEDKKFNMAVMGLRLAARSNGVAELHGTVSQAMFHGLWPGVDTEEVPIGSITNGVHGRSWTSLRVDALLSRAIGDDWSSAGADRWANVRDMDPAEIWDTMVAGRRGLVRFVRGLLGGGVLNPDTLTIGFARRFATYKRATLLLSQPDRLMALLDDADRPVQFVFAGKAHPADTPGKQLIQKIEQFARKGKVRHRFVFLTDYDIAIAREMYHGCDVWLNTPRRPLEACGTSGMKAALNGALNCSILDGWWNECYSPGNGWAIESAENDPDLERRDERECASLFSVLEDQVIPTFYERTSGGLPRAWVEMIQESWATLGPRVIAARMVRDYVTDLYEPAAADSRALTASNDAVAAALADWRSRIRTAWPGIRITAVDVDSSAGDTGTTRAVTATVDLDGLDPADVRVEAMHGIVGTDGEFSGRPEAVQLQPMGDGTYRGDISLSAPGSYGVTARVLPVHEALASPFDLGLATWA
ncbi:alpha-glucan family phosphorylase [Desertimonas flava]|jgi:starch phosphorylase|uniref:alpha-glucan family phosphorylase n=1 Tax=Desertimonas flava TaxID=2064846 RepID=UPI000E353A04|nr:alpha-glucan family phosphorylase [Desertimonas flava]